MLAGFTKWLTTLLGSVQVWKAPPFITLGSTAYKVKGDEQRVILGILQSGDLVLRRYDHYVTSLAIPGFYSHVGVVRNNTQIIHAVHEGVISEDVLTYLRTDYILVLRPRASGFRYSAVQRAITLLGRPYDFAFDTVDKSALYCTETALYCYSEQVPDRSELKPRVPPDKLLDFDTFEAVFDSKEYRDARK